jgi:hypothetical protein
MRISVYFNLLGKVLNRPVSFFNPEKPGAIRDYYFFSPASLFFSSSISAISESASFKSSRNFS